MAWTSAQKKAIETKDKTLLVSAAAGSGKTAVLIERIIESLTDKNNPADISRMLIVTFTRAAAGELKERVSKALSSAISKDPTNKNLFKQIASLSSAHISTIDSFYANVVRQNFQRLNIPSTLNLACEAELVSMRKRIMNDVIELAYEGKVEGTVSKETVNGETITRNDFIFLSKCLSDAKSESKLCEIFIDIHKSLILHPKHLGFLKENIESYRNLKNEDLFSSPIGKVIQYDIKSAMEYAKIVAENLCELAQTDEKTQKFYLPSFESDCTFCKDILLHIDKSSYKETREKFLNFTHKPLGPIRKDKTEVSEKCAYIRSKKIKVTITGIKDKYFKKNYSDEFLNLCSEKIARNFEVLYNILSLYDKLYSEEKLSKNIYEFDDMKIWTYKLLVNPDGTPSDIAKSISDNFDAVYIDEYQDVDFLQDLIFRSVSKPRSMFMVGDIKQSIYKFRGAEPSLFMNYRSKFAQIDAESDSLPEDDDCTIFMSSNFRCDKNIIKFTNEVCSYIFKNAGKSIGYTDDDDLIFAKTDPNSDEKVNVVLIEKEKKNKDEDNDEDRTHNDDEDGFESCEGGFIVHEIRELLAHGIKNDGTPILPKDIAILVRKESVCKEVAKELDKYKIKHTGSTEETIFDDKKVSICFSLMAVIDNPQRDIYLSAVLMSPLFNFSADDLIEIRNMFNKVSIFDSIYSYANLSSSENSEEIDFNPSLSKKCKYFISTINEIREDCSSMSADNIIQHIFSIFPEFLSQNDGKKNSEKALIKFYDNARNYEKDEFQGLYKYVKYVENMIENDKAPQNEDGDADDTIKILTIHRSKGLEFPVCFIAGCSRQLKGKDSKNKIIYSSNLGFSMNLTDNSGFGKIKTLHNIAMKKHIDDTSVEEEMRVLYVALTRARERLYITATFTGEIQSFIDNIDIDHPYVCRHAILNSTSYIEWIMSAMHNKFNKGFANLKIIKAADIIFDAEQISEKVQTDDESKCDLPLTEVYEKIKENLNFEYPYSHISNLPAKLSVSKLSPSVLDINDAVSLDDDNDSLDIKLPELSFEPSFILSDAKSPSAAEKGTATHTFLQFCDFDRVKFSGVKNEISRLVQEKFISESMGQIINIKQAEMFFSSDFFKELEKAKKIYREQRFNIMLPCAEFTSDEDYKKEIANEKILVQGVMDLFFIDKDDKLILCDYKTDYLSEFEIKNRNFAEEKLRKAHTRQLSYYNLALKSIFGKAPDKVLIYSLPLGDTVEVFPDKIDE